MKKSALLNSDLSAVIARMGHNDMLVIGDAGLPIPDGPQRIDLALTRGVPGFIETLRVVLSEMQVERVIIAQETERVSPEILRQIRQLIGETPSEWFSHEEFKQRTAFARAAVRTGEFTPFANIILIAGVVF